MQKINKGFTLVELIVVITILAILWTIAFISLQWYSSEARDSKRISDLWQIRTGLQLQKAREWEMLIPDSFVNIWSWTTNYLIQWYAWTWTLNTIRVSDNAKDPLDSEYYTYTVNSNKTKFQLMALLENETLVKNIVPKTFANYENRYPYIIWNTLWILMEPVSNTPVQENNVQDIDLSDSNDYTAIFTRDEWAQTLSWWTIEQKIIDNLNESEIINDWSDETVVDYTWTSTSTQIVNYNSCETSDWTTWDNIFEWWDWSNLNPYVISYDYQLDAIKCNLNWSYVLNNDIYLSSYLSWSWWEPIWTYSSTPFNWNLDWAWNTVHDLFIDNVWLTWVWLFWDVWISWNISNLNINANWVTWNDRVWVFAWNFAWSVDNVNVNLLWNLNWSVRVWWFVWNLSADWVMSNNSIVLNNAGQIIWGSFVWWFVWVPFWSITSSYSKIDGNITSNTQTSWGFAWNIQSSSNISKSYSIVNWDIYSWKSWPQDASNVWWFAGLNNWTISESYSIVNGTLEWQWEDIGWFLWYNSWFIDNTYSIVYSNLTWSERVWGFVGMHTDAVNPSAYISNSYVVMMWNLVAPTNYWNFVWYSFAPITNSYSSNTSYSYFWNNVSTITWNWDNTSWNASNSNTYWKQDIGNSNFLINAGSWDSNIWNYDSNINSWYPFLANLTY